MQNAVPKGEGGMVAVLGSKIEDIENILNRKCQILLKFKLPMIIQMDK